MMFQAQNGEYCEKDHSMHAKGGNSKEDHSIHAEGLAAHRISFIRFCFLLLLLGWLQQGAGSTAEDAGFYIHRQHAGGVLQQQLL